MLWELLLLCYGDAPKLCKCRDGLPESQRLSAGQGLLVFSA